LSSFGRLEFLDLANPFKRALRDYSLGTLGLGAEFARSSGALAYTASSTAANNSASASAAASVVVTGASPASTLSATGAPTLTPYEPWGREEGELAVTGAQTAEHLFLHDACAPIYKLIIEGNQPRAVIARCFQIKRGGNTVDEVKRVCGLMFANTMEIKRAHSLAKAILNVSFDHHGVGDTTICNNGSYWGSSLCILAPHGGEMDKTLVQLDKLSII
jgi:hypothetical protein